MFGKIVWAKSGDEIKFSSACPDLLVYYVDHLNSNDANKFRLDKTKFSFNTVDAFVKVCKSIESISNKIPIKIKNWNGKVLDQEYLNQVHRDWVQTGIEYPSIILLLRKMNNLDKDYREINTQLHKIESSFVYSFKNFDQDPYQIENIFGTKVLGFDKPNISLGFDNLGRSSWEKFCNFDENAKGSDTNNFNKLSGLIHFNLNRPISGNPPPEYVKWCETKNIPIVGKTLNLGNICDLESQLTDLRKIVIRNVNEQDDRFFFEVCTK